MARTRDSQRQKVYNAEGRAGYVKGVVAFDEAQEMLELLVTEFQVRPVEIQVNRRIKQYGGWYKAWERLIEVPRASVQVSTVLHEFAHHLAHERQVGTPGHGAGYTDCMLQVVEAWLGKKAREVLNLHYTMYNVKVGADIVLAEQTKAKERMDRDGEEAWVYVISYEGYAGTFFLKNLDLWDNGTRDIDYARVYKTENGATKAAKKYQGQVYAVRAQYSSYYDKHIPKNWNNDLTLVWEGV